MMRRREWKELVKQVEAGKRQLLRDEEAYVRRYSGMSSNELQANRASIESEYENLTSRAADLDAATKRIRSSRHFTKLVDSYENERRRLGDHRAYVAWGENHLVFTQSERDRIYGRYPDGSVNLFAIAAGALMRVKHSLSYRSQRKTLDMHRQMMRDCEQIFEKLSQEFETVNDLTLTGSMVKPSELIDRSKERPALDEEAS